MWYCSFEVIPSGGDNISVEYEKIYFNPDTIDNFNQFAKSYKFKIRYFYGYLVKFDKVNVYAISPHKILFSKKNINLLVLHYDYYIGNDNLYFVDGEKQPFTMTAIKKYIREYFKKNI